MITDFLSRFTPGAYNVLSYTNYIHNHLPQLSGSYWVSRLLRDRDAVLRALAAELLARLMQPGAEGTQAMVAQVGLGDEQCNRVNGRARVLARHLCRGACFQHRTHGQHGGTGSPVLSTGRRSSLCRSLGGAFLPHWNTPQSPPRRLRHVLSPNAGLAGRGAHHEQAGAGPRQLLRAAHRGTARAGLLHVAGGRAR